MFSEVTECHDGKVVFVITKEMIDELIEVGFYSFQIRLFDESQISRVTIPPVLKGIDIRNPIAAEDETNVVDIGLVDYAVVVKDEFEDLSTFLPDGNYNKTEWESKDVISGAKLNKIEDALYNINSNMEATDLALLNRVENINKNIYAEITQLGDELKDEIEEFEGDIKYDIKKFKVDVDSTINTSLNELREEKANYLDLYKNQDVAICVGYSIQNKRPGLFVTYDGINISRVDEFDNFPSSRWDFGVVFLDGYFYLCYDYIDPNFNGYNQLDNSFFRGGNRIGISRTTNFKDFEHWTLDIPLEFKQTFSPKFFIDDNGKYITLVMGRCDETTTDAWGREGYKKYCYIIECDDAFKVTSTPTLINLTDGLGKNGSCKLDPYILKVDGTYNLFIKEEDNDYIQQYRSTSLSAGYEIINEFKNYGRCEAPCVYYFNNEYLLFKYDHETKYNMVLRSKDLLNWSEPFVCDIYGDSAVMNASFLVCDNENTKKIVYDYIKDKGAEPFNDDYSKNFSYRMFNQTQEIKSDCELIATPNTLYYIKGITQAAINLNVNKLFIGDKIYFTILSGNEKAKLIINKHDKVYFNGTQGALTLDNRYMNDILTLSCLNYKKECIISGVREGEQYSPDIEEQGFVDENTGLSVIFYKNNRTVNVLIAGVFKKVVPSNNAVVTSFTVPSKFRPIRYSFNSYLLGNGEYNNIKIDSDGKMEIVVSRTVTANSTYFECSMTYLTRG